MNDTPRGRSAEHDEHQPSGQTAQGGAREPRWPDHPAIESGQPAFAAHRSREADGHLPEPADHEPQPVSAEAAQFPRMIPSRGARPGVWSQVVTHLSRHGASRNLQRADQPAGTAGVLGRQYMAMAIARLGEHHRQAAADPEPEVGA